MRKASQHAFFDFIHGRINPASRRLRLLLFHIRNHRPYVWRDRTTFGVEQRRGLRQRSRSGFGASGFQGAALLEKEWAAGLRP